VASCKSKCGCKAQIRCAESEAASCEWFQAIVSGVITSLSTAKPLLPEIEIVILKPRADSEPFQTASFPLPKRNYLKNVRHLGTARRLGLHDLAPASVFPGLAAWMEHADIAGMVLKTFVIRRFLRAMTSTGWSQHQQRLHNNRRLAAALLQETTFCHYTLSSSSTERPSGHFLSLATTFLEL